MFSGATVCLCDQVTGPREGQEGLDALQEDMHRRYQVTGDALGFAEGPKEEEKDEKELTPTDRRKASGARHRR